MSAKCMSNIKWIGAFARLYCFVEICWNLHPFSELKNVFFANFRTFLKFSKCKALGDFLISFLERVPLKGCLGDISQNWNFWNWFEILDIFRHWLLNSKNGGDEKCSQCACFWLIFEKYHLKKQLYLLYLVFNSYASALIKRHPLPKWENDFCWFILLGLVEGESWLKSYVSHDICL